ncbi:T-complex protein 1 subunit delta [Tanacetum coccineum]
MDKLISTASGDVIITNDGATILNKMQVLQPAAKMLVELSKSQDVIAGDETTTVVVNVGALLKHSHTLLPWDQKNGDAMKVNASKYYLKLSKSINIVATRMINTIRERFVAGNVVFWRNESILLVFVDIDNITKGQTATGKESSNPFMAGSLPKTIHFCDSLQSDEDSFELIELMILCTIFLTMGRIDDADAEVTFIDETLNDARNKNNKISKSKVEDDKETAL